MNEKIKSPSGQSGGGGGSGAGTPSGPPGGGPVITGSNNGGNAAGGPPGVSTVPTAMGGMPPAGGPPTSNNGSDLQTAPHSYGPPGSDPAAVAMSHYHLHQQPHPPQQHMPQHQQAGPGGLPPQNPGEHPNKDEYGQNPLGGPPPPPGGHHPVYGRYHHADPNMDPYRYGHSPMQQPPPGGKPQQQPLPPSGPGGGISSPNRPPPQRYIPGQPPQGPTPTLNSLLQSSHPPPPPQHRYANSYDPQLQQQQQGAQPQQQGGPQGPHGPPPPPHHPYGAQQGGWAPPPRPYSPQLGPSQAYRTPPPTNTSRGQSPYPPTHGQNSGSYPSSPQQQQQQPGGPPPPPQSSNQGTATTQYSPYPQRYPTPPGPLATGPNHRTAYSTHQYPEPNRPWPGGSSPAPSPGPGGHPHPPASPHQSQHGGPPPSSSPGHAPSPSPQPSQASPSPHQELIGQNSNDSSSGGAHSGIGSGPPGTPNSQQVMRPTPSPTGSSGSRSMSPAVVQNHPISRPSSNQSSSVGPMQQPGGPPLPLAHMTQGAGGMSLQQPPQQPPTQQQGPGGPVNSASSSASNSPQQQIPPQGTPSQQQHQPPPNQSVNNMPAQPPQVSGAGGVGGYPPPPHMHSGYKMGVPGPGAGQGPGPGAQGGYPPPQQQQQYSQGNYPPRPQYPPSSYAPTQPPTNQASSVNNMTPGGPQQYPGRPMPNHTGASPYPPYQNWVPPSPQSGGPGSGAPVSGAGAVMGNHVQGKGTPPPGGPPPPPGGGSPRQLNYLKQHLQHKGGYGSSPTPPQGYGNGPGMHPGMPMGPPPHMAPPHGPTSMGPPTSTPPQSMMGGSGVPPLGDNSIPEHISQDNGISSSGSSTASGPHPVTSVVTTGPDGTPMDEVSQQSTLSNASAASGEDPQCTTPKSRKNDPYGQSHLVPPSTSPGGAHPGHMGAAPPSEDYEMSSPPNWTRTAASPQVFNSHVAPQETYRTSTKKSDSLCKLYEMDDNPDRRVWLDKLRAYMDERRSPITACPTISKQPLDLYRLYNYVKERGGFVEVTKSKTWKDIAGLLGIGASSSAAYTLRKHYMRNLLPFECHFDRGDIDPLPIIQQAEAGTKKKTTKAASVPSPAGSSNSQDSFPQPGAAANAVIDGYPGYPGAYPGTAGPQPDYGAGGQMQRPPSQSNAQAPHAGNAQAAAGDNISVSNPFDDPVGGSGAAPPRATPYQQQGSSYTPVSRAPGSPYPGQPGAYGQYGSSDQYNAAGPPGQFGQSQGQFPPPQNRNMYPPYGPEGEAPPPGSNQYGPYGNRPYSQPPPGGAQTTPTPTGAGVSSAAGPPTGAPAGAPGATYPPGASGAPTQQDYYRPPEQSPQPRRHPDFVKDTQPYPGYNARPQIYGGWQGGSNQYRAQYPSTPSPQAWGGAPPRTAAPPGPLGGPPPNQQASAAAQWEQHRYAPQQAPPPPQQQPPYQPQNQQQPPPPPQWAQMAGSAQPPQTVAPGSPLRPPLSQQQQQQQQQQQRMPCAPTVGLPVAPGQQPGPPTGVSVGSMPKPPFSMPPPPQSGVQLGGSPVGPPPVGPPNAVGVLQTSMALPAVQKPVTGVPPQVANVGPQQQPGPQNFPQPGGTPLAKKEIIFPPDSVEATAPVLYRRKRLAKADVCPVDPWRIFMAMRSGLLTECTWALDVLNVLLFDDSSVQYFGLSHLPGLLTLLLEHFQKYLTEMFTDVEDNEHGAAAKSVRCFRYSRKRPYNNNNNDEAKGAEDIDLGQIREHPNPEERVLLLSHTPNYTLLSRKGLPVRIQLTEDDIFVADDQKAWDVDTDKLYEQSVAAGSNAWTFGCMERESLDGIIDVFKSEIIDIPFARRVRGRSEKRHGVVGEEKQQQLQQQKKKTEANEATVMPTEAVTAIKKETSEVNPSADEADEEESKVQQPANKKRRYCHSSSYSSNSNSNNNSSCSSSGGKMTAVTSPSNALNSNLEASNTKKMKLRGEEGTFVQPEVKRESGEAETTTAAPTVNASLIDSDCREVDMEIEAPQQQRQSVALNGGVAAIVQPKRFDPKSTARDSALILQRRRDSSYEDESYTRDEASLYLVNESQDSLARRCICLSNIFRNLTFVPGNETILAKSPRFLAILGRLLLLNHEHLPRTPKTRNYDREEDNDFTDSCSSLQGEREWWWDYLVSIRENMLVAMANIAGHLELVRYEELIARPLIDGLLHWAVCPSAHGQDPFPSCGPSSALSPQRLALEALCKLCVTDANVDLVIATPPHARLEKLCAVLTRHLCRNEDQVLREFSVNLLHYLAAADSAMARTVALQAPCISYLVAFIEQAEQTALGVANQHGINYLRENPDSMGTSLDMLRRAAGTLLHLAKHPDNRSLFMQQEQRLLGLVMSHILDQQVALIISRVLFQVSRGPGPLPSSEFRLQQQRQQIEASDKKASSRASESAEAEVKVEVKTELKTEPTEESTNAANDNTNTSSSSSGSNTSKLTTVTTTAPATVAMPNVAAAATTNATADENSNSSNQLPPAAALNDVSNSSTNSNSCSNSSVSNATSCSNNNNISINNGNSSSNHLVNNNNSLAETTAKINNNGCEQQLQQPQQHQLQQQQQQQQPIETPLTSNKNINLGASHNTTTTASIASNNNISNSLTNSNSNSNSNSSSSISSTSTAAAVATPAAATTPPPPTPAPPAAATAATPATTTAAVA